MASLSKFFQVTNQVLLEYRTDQYKITRTNAETGADHALVIMYQGDDGNQYCLEIGISGEVNNVSKTAYSITDDTVYNMYYGGQNPDFTYVDTSSGEGIYGNDIYVNNNNVGTIIKDAMGNSTRTEYIRVDSSDNITTGPLTLNHDVIRIYLLSGYVMNNIAGYSLKVKAPVNKVTYEGTLARRVNDFIYLLDWFMPHEELKDNIQWLSQPMYLNSKIYDRYIEVKFPSPLDCALNQRNIDYVYEYTDEDTDETIYFRGYINSNSCAFVDFSTVQYDNTSMYTSTTHTYECKFTPDINSTIGVAHSAESNYFNIRLYEDTENKGIMYYPVYGDPADLASAEDFNMDVMNAIETGVIQMCDLSEYDHLNDGMDDFIETYGEDADKVYKWIIINELAVTYNYEHIISRVFMADEVIPPYTEYYTNTIDYTGKSSDNGEFWKSKFVPNIPKRAGYVCKSITLSYTAHLYNRMNGIDIIRRGSMAIIDNPYKYELSSFNTNNITLYKVVNRIEKNNIEFKKPEATETAGQIVRSYYNVTNIMAKTDTSNLSYTLGKLTLSLTHTNNNYLIRLFTLNDDNTRVPLDLTGTTEYKLVFPAVNGDTIEIFPKKDSANYNLGIGSLVFYITKDKAKAIMEVPASERYFAVTTHVLNNSQEETTLYEGLVDWA